MFAQILYVQQIMWYKATLFAITADNILLLDYV